MPTCPSINLSKRIFLIALCATLISCGGTKILDNPAPLTLGEPLAATTNELLETTLDWVIVRDGPGTWARNADWDEYLVRFNNTFPAVVSIEDVAIYDSSFTRLQSMGERKSLVAASRETARRYKGQGVEVKAGLGGGVMMAAGAVGGTAAVGAGAAALYMSSAAAATTLGVLLAAPALVVGGVVKSVNQNRVDGRISQLHATLPVSLEPNEVRGLNFFFPLAPAPRKLEVVYSVAGEDSERILEVDISIPLEGLHLAP